MTITPEKHDQIVKHARVWVAQTFYGEMLKQMRNSPFKSEMFSGGRGGEAFASQLDQRIAERLSRSNAGERLAQSIVRRIEGKSYVPPTDRT